MPNERQECPKCGRIMKYIWSSPQEDQKVEAVIDRFQRCQFCYVSIDVASQQQYSITRIADKLFVDRHGYSHVRDWLKAIGLYED